MCVHLRKDAQTAATADWNAVDVGGPAFVLAVDTAGKTIPNRILKVCEKEKILRGLFFCGVCEVQAAALGSGAVLEVEFLLPVSLRVVVMLLTTCALELRV